MKLVLKSIHNTLDSKIENMVNYYAFSETTTKKDNEVYTEIEPAQHRNKHAESGT